MSLGKANASAICKGSISVIRNLLGGGKAMASQNGYARLITFDKNGNFKQDTGWIHNNYVNGGKAFTAAITCGQASPNPMDYLAVGSSSQVEDDADTALITEISTSGLARAQDASPTLTTTSTTDDTSNINYSWSVSGTETIWEIGVFNAAAAGTMQARTKLATSVTVNDADTCNGSYQVIHA